MKTALPIHRLLCAALLASGCASANTPSNVLQADEAMVSDCQYVGDVVGTSMLPGPGYVDRCQQSALSQADNLGATHLRWTSLNNGATGKAYKCGGPATTPTQASSNVLEADERMVSGCQYLDDVTGSGFPGPGYVERCKQSALRKADKLGATHLLWTSLNNSATGKAYKCTGSPARTPAQ